MKTTKIADPLTDVDLVIIESETQAGDLRLQLKIHDQHRAEVILGRDLDPYELPKFDEDGKLTLLRAPLPVPWKTIEVKPVVKSGGRILVSEEGDLISLSTLKTLSQNLIGEYLGTITRPNGRAGKCVALKTHQCVAEAFVKKPENQSNLVVNHKDGIKSNVTKDNLEWVTGQRNTQHAYDKGLIRRATGSELPYTQLTETAVASIRLNVDCKSQRSLAREHNVHHSTIQAVLSGRTHVDR